MNIGSYLQPISRIKIHSKSTQNFVWQYIFKKLYALSLSAQKKAAEMFPASKG